MIEKSIGQSAAILNSDFIAIAMVKDRHILWANAAMHRIFGYQPDELIGSPTRNLFLNQESYETFGRESYPAIAKGGTYTGIIPQKRKDGTTGWYEFNLSRLAGHPDTVVGAIVDRTPTYEAGRLLEESESRYRSVVEDQTEIIARYLPDGRFVFVNETFCRLFGKAANELLGQRWQPAAYPDDLPMIEARLREMTPDNPVVTIENRVLSANGEIRWMQFVNRGFYDADGVLKETQAVGRDITSLKQVEAALQKSEELNRRTLQALPAHIAVLDRDGRIVATNDAWESFAAQNGAAGKPSITIGGNYFEACRHAAVEGDEDAARALAGIDAVMTKRQLQFTMEYPCHSPQEQRWYYMTVVRLSDLGDSGVVITHLNVTDLKQAELRLRESQESLHRAQSVARIGSFETGNNPEVFRHTKETARLFDLDESGTTFPEWFSRVHPDDQCRVETEWRAALQGVPYNSIYRIVVQGQIRWIRALAELQFDEHGQFIKAVGTVQDISDLKQVESDLRESDERLELALAGSGLVLWDWDIPERKVTAGNRWFDLLGFTKEELGNDEDNWMALINPNDLERFTQKLTSHLQGETANFESEHRLRHKDGHWVSVEAKGKVTRRDQDGNPLRMVGTILDITQRKRLNKEGMDLLKQIEALIRKSTSRTSIKEEEDDKAVASLTKRQRQILTMIASGMTSANIGKRLHLSTQTVISHRQNLMAKLKLHSTAELTRFAIEHNLLTSK